MELQAKGQNADGLGLFGFDDPPTGPARATE